MIKDKIILTVLACLSIAFFINAHHAKRNILNGDSWGYYTYLTALFIHHDHGDYTKSVAATRKYYAEFPDQHSDVYGLYHLIPETNKELIKYTSGVAILLVPTFLMAHAYQHFMHLDADGYAPIYNLAAGIAVILWCFIGAYFLLRLLKKYFSKEVAWFTLISLIFGTNVLYNMLLVPVMSHALLFSLYSIFLYLVDSYYTSKSAKKMIWIGLVAGLITLIRLNELYTVLILLLWNIKNVRELKTRFHFLFSNFKHYFLAAAFALLPLLPQMYYWKKYAGHLIFNAYLGETFHFGSPQIWNGLTSFNNGWLIWTPIMLLALMGLFIKWKKDVALMATLIILPIHIYIIYSWHCWNYINGFGSRPMEHVYPLLALGLASFYTFVVLQKNKLIRYGILTLAYFLIFLNMFQFYQSNIGVLRSEFCTRAQYMASLFQTKFSHRIMIGRASNEWQPSKSTFLKTIKIFDFEEQGYWHRDSTLAHQSQYCFFDNSPHLFLDTFDVATDFDKANYIKISCMAYFKDDIAPKTAAYETPRIYIQFKDEAFNNLENDRGFYPFQFCNNPDFSFYHTGEPFHWGHAYFYLKNRKHAKYAILGIWNGAQDKWYMDDLKIEAFN